MTLPSPARRALRPALALLSFSLGLRLLAAWVLGEGAPFGPDGAGVEAAVSLPGHLYPAHVWLVSLTGSARSLSLASGPVTSLCLWIWGRRLGLGGGGGWLHAALPLAVFTGALSAGDAPALAVVAVGCALATGPGWLLPGIGGALAVASAAVKPSALPACLLLVATPRALLGAGLALPLLRSFLSPLLSPLAGGGLLGSWWLASGGLPPASLSAWVGWVRRGLSVATHIPWWTGVGLTGLAALRSTVPCRFWLRLAALGPLLAAVALAALLGGRLEPRYLQAVVLAALPFVGAWLSGWRLAPALFVLLPLSWALVSQVAVVRHRRDPEARVPAVPPLLWPGVGADEIFFQCSTNGATALRRQAGELALSLPPGAQVLVARRRDGREGELVWPLRVARPDVVIVPVAAGTPGAL